MYKTRNILLLSSLLALPLTVAISQGCDSGSSKTSNQDNNGGMFNTGGFNTGNNGGGSVGGGCAETTSEAIEGALPADIILAVDNSGSMTEEAVLVQDSMNEFASTIIGSGIDAHIIVISADSGSDEGICVPQPLGSGACPNDQNLPVYRHVVQEVASSNSLELILQTYDSWKESLRPGASRIIAVISDDNSAMSAADFTTQMIALDPSFQGFKFDAIVSPYELSNPLLCFNCTADNCTACDPCCGPNTDPFPACIDLPAEEGTVYKELVQQTGGVLGDLCTQYFSPVFDDMATAVIANAQIACVYYIPDPGEGETLDYSKVNVDYYPDAGGDPHPVYYIPGGQSDCGVDGGWYYDDPEDPSQIIFCEATCTTVQGSSSGKVVIKFGCATLIGPPA